MALARLSDTGLPRVGFEAVRPAPENPLRTDIALFIGSAQYGPVMEPVRVAGGRAFAAAFGALLPDANLPHALEGYFENEGLAAYIIRLAPGAGAAAGTWDLATDGGFAPASIGHLRQTMSALTPGEWGNRLQVYPTYRLGSAGEPLLDFDIRLGGELRERLPGIAANRMAEEFNARSQLVRIEPDETSPLLAAASGVGPRRREWRPVRLQSGTAGTPPSRTDYVEALERAMDVREAALIALPDLHRHCSQEDAAAVIGAGARLADARLDRMLIADAPEAIEDATGAQAWLSRFANDPAVARAAAFYHPWVLMRDPIGTLHAPLRTLPPSGHLCGLISRCDRDKGAYVTPANVSLAAVADLARRPGDAVQGALNTMGINALRCQSGRGIVVWGGRLPAIVARGAGFVAHRRLIHRLVRSLRRVAEPLVFDPNDRSLALAIARPMTTLLMEAFHSGVLKGTRPDEAFKVDVGPEVNDAASRDAGRLLCDIAIAPAVPMEFIHFRIGLTPDGEVEMVEA